MGGTRDFAEVLIELATLGYGVEYALLNSSAFGVPQSRERIYTALSEILQPEVSQAAEGGEPGSRWKRQRGKILSFRATDGEALNQVIGGPQGSRIYSTDGVSPTLTSGGGGLGTKTGLYFVKKDPQNGIVTKEKCGTIDASYYKGLGARQQRTGVMETSLPQAVIQPDKEKTWQNGRRIKGPDEAMFTMMASCVHGVLLDSRIRRLTPLEAFRLQGVPDEYFERAAAECSDSQLYKQAGLAVRAANQFMPCINCCRRQCYLLRCLSCEWSGRGSGNIWRRKNEWQQAQACFFVGKKPGAKLHPAFLYFMKEESRWM